MSNLKCHPVYQDTALFGVEVELENVPGLDRERQYPMRTFGLGKYEDDWRVTYDGTLRNGGVEFVSNGVQAQKALRSSLHKMMKDLKEYCNFDKSFRTSTHIHIDIRDLNRIQLMVFILKLVSIEDELFELAGKGREKSPFAVRCDNAATLIPTVYKALKNRRTPVRMNADFQIPADMKYSSINVEAIRKMGSVELRHFHPITTGKVFVDVTNHILACYHQAQEFTGDMELDDAHLSNDVLKICKSSIIAEWFWSLQRGFE